MLLPEQGVSGCVSTARKSSVPLPIILQTTYVTMAPQDVKEIQWQELIIHVAKHNNDATVPASASASGVRSGVRSGLRMLSGPMK